MLHSSVKKQQNSANSTPKHKRNQLGSLYSPDLTRILKGGNQKYSESLLIDRFFTHKPLRSTGRRGQKSSVFLSPKLNHNFAQSAAQKQTLSPKVSEQEKFPITPTQAFKSFGKRQNKYERQEMKSYPAIYYLGLDAEKPKSLVVKGVYQAMPRDQIGYRFQVMEKIGEGTFSQVFLALDHKTKQEVALKIVKNRHNFLELSLREIAILHKIRRTYHSSSYSVDLIQHFLFRSHRILVFNRLTMSVYDCLKQSKTTGLPIRQIVTTTYQVLLALQQIHHTGIVHCDLKPENIMYTDKNLDKVKLIDFGSACQLKKAQFPYIQSRYYRAPEVILGYAYKTEIDMWSFGCILLEMCSGKPCFVGDDEAGVLRRMIEYKGYPSAAYLANAPKSGLLEHSVRGLSPASLSFKNLVCGDQLALDLALKCLEWEPHERITASAALNHPYFSRRSHRRVAKESKSLKGLSKLNRLAL